MRKNIPHVVQWDLDTSSLPIFWQAQPLPVRFGSSLVGPRTLVGLLPRRIGQHHLQLHTVDDPTVKHGHGLVCTLPHTKKTPMNLKTTPILLSHGESTVRLNRLACLSAYFMYPKFLPGTTWTSMRDPKRLKETQTAGDGQCFLFGALQQLNNSRSMHRSDHAYQKTSSRTSCGSGEGLKTTNSRSLVLLSDGASFFREGRVTSVWMRDDDEMNE